MSLKINAYRAKMLSLLCLNNRNTSTCSVLSAQIPAFEGFFSHHKDRLLINGVISAFSLLFNNEMRRSIPLLHTCRLLFLPCGKMFLMSSERLFQSAIVAIRVIQRVSKNILNIYFILLCSEKQAAAAEGQQKRDRTDRRVLPV